MKVKFILIICVILALVFSCAKPPVEEMDNAKEAVFKAENDEDAVQYASGTLARARDALRRMQNEADSKNYEAAKTLAAEAIVAADKAITDGKAASIRDRDEAASLLSGLRPEIEETERNINGARYSLLALNYNDLERDLRTAEDDADQAEANLQSSKYQDAIEKGMSARSIIGGINEKITNAATASSAKK